MDMTLTLDSVPLFTKWKNANEYNILLLERWSQNLLIEGELINEESWW